MPPADWPTDVLPPVPAQLPPSRPPLERVRAAAEAVMLACGVVAMLAADAILIVVFLAVWQAR